MINDKLTNLLKENQQKLIIFGTGVFGERIFKTCKLNGIVPACFCDNNDDNIGKYKEGVEVLSLDIIMNKYKNPIFIISPFEEKHQKSIIQQISKYNNNFNLIEYYKLSEFFLNINEVYCESIFEEIELHKYKMENHAKENKKFLYKDWIELKITTRCTLNCKSCVHLVPYYKTTKDFDKEMLFKSIDCIDELFDSVTKLYILGGEPLIHKDIYDIIKYAQSKKSIFSIFIITNGTILPKIEEIKKLNPEKLVFTFSDYGILAKKQDEFVKLLDGLNYNYSFSKTDFWNDCSNIKFRDKTIQELEETYNECWNNYIQIDDGKLFNCPYLSNVYHLKAIPSKDIQYIDILDNSKTNEEKREEIRKYLFNKNYLNACNWCVGRTKSEISIIPKAIQINKKIDYKIYD